MKIKLTKKQFEKLYLGKPLKEVCQRLSISRPTLYALLSKAGIKLKGRGKRSIVIIP